ncbi:uncharacterized protein METZ01_LOCUS500304, partial [marine metagenome]
MNELKRMVIVSGLVSLGLTVQGQFTLPGVSTTVSVMSTLQGINANTAAMLSAKNEANRRALRGTSLSEPVSGESAMNPENTGAQPQLGSELGRSQAGRPTMVNLLPEVPEIEFPVTGDPEENQPPEMNDPFTDDPNGGAGSPEANQSPEMNDPFTDDPFGGASNPEENQSPEMNDPKVILPTVDISPREFSLQAAGEVRPVVVYGTS